LLRHCLSHALRQLVHHPSLPRAESLDRIPRRS